MSAEKKTLKFQMMMSPEEAKELDDWMFKNRLRSRAEAIRRLCQMALLFDSKTEEISDILKKNTGEIAAALKGYINGNDSKKLNVVDIVRFNFVEIIKVSMMLESIHSLGDETLDYEEVIDMLKKSENTDVFLEKFLEMSSLAAGGVEE